MFISMLTMLVSDGNGMWPVKSLIEHAEQGFKSRNVGWLNKNRKYTEAVG